MSTPSSFSMSFRFEPLSIPDVIRITPARHGDFRGFFSETYRASAFQDAGIQDVFYQDNHARSSRGVLRGLHYQAPPKAQAKLVRVVRGEVFDVAVDFRVGSPTFGQWAGGVLSGEDGVILYVPEGFAHGYVCLSESADLVYKVSNEFDPALDRGIAWDDPAIGIPWPVENPALSERDLSLPGLESATSPFQYEQ
jgi:dTDP-4-dehydrorhamnose 3,5-epimerase